VSGDRRAAKIAAYDQAEARAVDILMSHVAELDGQDSAVAGVALSRWLDRQALSRYALASLLAAVALRLYRSEGGR
jgi:hypothetical protein